MELSVQVKDLSDAFCKVKKKKTFDYDSY